MPSATRLGALFLRLRNSAACLRVEVGVTVNATAPLSVDVWLDIACPFCALGDRRLESVISELPFAEHIDVRYHSYQLDPSAPEHAKPGSQTEMLLARGMDPKQLEASHNHLVSEGARENFIFNFDETVPSNTFTAHRFLQAARAENVQQSVLDALFVAYFTDGVDLGNVTEVRDRVVAAGLSAAAADAVVNDTDTFRPEVEADIAQAAAYGIQGVPFFVLAGKYGISGAQPAAAFTEALTQVYGELQSEPRATA